MSSSNNSSLNVAQNLSQPTLLDNLIKWLPVIIGLLVLYIPSVQYLAENLWHLDDHAHGPIIVIVVLYLFWQKREIFSQPTENLWPVLGSTLLFLGLLTYAIGRSQEILFFEIGSLIPILTGITLVTIGKHGINRLWFAIFFTLFIIPLPGPVVDLLTNPLKQYISVFAENILYELGYPIARSGVVISIGPYQLLVADACSGLHSMFSLSALGFLYLYLMQYKNWLRNAVVISSILPIAFLANLIRVITLILVTYYFGDEVGQGFVHKFAGMFLFVTSLIFLFLFDGVLGKLPLFKDKSIDKKS
ncbi:MAG TPA: exosortase B [Methylotenera sp.]|nr:exosortase B [Methylotenera sp.]